MVAAGIGQNILDLTFVVGIGEFGIATARRVLGQGHRIVGVIAIGRAGAGDDQPLDPVGHTGGHDIARAGDIHGKGLCAGHAGWRGHD